MSTCSLVNTQVDDMLCPDLIAMFTQRLFCGLWILTKQYVTSCEAPLQYLLSCKVPRQYLFPVRCVVNHGSQM